MYIHKHTYIFTYFLILIEVYVHICAYLHVDMALIIPIVIHIEAEIEWKCHSLISLRPKYVNFAG